MSSSSNEREECIFIPLKIAKRKRYKNMVGGVSHEAIQIAAESDLSTEQRHLRVQHTYGWGRRLLLLDPGRGQEKLRENSDSTMAWW